MAISYTETDILGIRQKKNGKLYVNAQEFTQEIIESQKRGVLSDTAVKMIQLMVKNLMSCKYYKNPDDRLDCEAQALADCCEAWTKFNPERQEEPNAFPFFISLISNGIAKGWNTVHNKKFKGNTFIPINENYNI